MFWQLKTFIKKNSIHQHVHSAPQFANRWANILHRMSHGMSFSIYVLYVWTEKFIHIGAMRLCDRQCVLLMLSLLLCSCFCFGFGFYFFGVTCSTIFTHTHIKLHGWNVTGMSVLFMRTQTCAKLAKTSVKCYIYVRQSHKLYVKRCWPMKSDVNENKNKKRHYR